jgi:para-nitrobenzyl esterase
MSADKMLVIFAIGGILSLQQQTVFQAVALHNRRCVVRDTKHDDKQRCRFDKRMYGNMLASAILMAAAMMAMPANAADRTVTGGIVRGIDLPDGGMLFRGIPYAAPPVGDLRWRRPQPVVPWDGVRDATRSGAPCFQRSYGWNAADAAAGKEDCLTLEVHVPRHDAGEKLPVMFWIHGGANRAGSGIGYSESAIVRHGVVLVTLQYRLGIFGFLSHPALTAETPDHASGNYGVMDQIAALKWVRANIAQFGGDPDNVTVFGQSAGAQDVGLLMLSPLARGLFHKAIEQSGTAGFGLPPRSLAENEKLGVDLAARMGFAADAKGLQALRAAPGDALLDAADPLVPPIEDTGFIWDQAVVDGFVIPDRPDRILSGGRQAHIPLIIGNNARELPLYGGRANLGHAIESYFGDHAKDALAFYGLDGDFIPSDHPVLGSVETQLATDMMFRCPANEVAGRQRRIGQPVWRYQFDVAKRGSPDPVWHSSELSYVFDHMPDGVGPDEWPPVQIYWTNFAKTADPNGEGLPYWPEMGSERHYMEFTLTGPVVAKDLRGPLGRYCGRP